ncbi:phosphatidic acid phosphatase, partial [Clavibacter phaseoli]
MTRPASGSARRDAGPASAAPTGLASTGDRLPP